MGIGRCLHIDFSTKKSNGLIFKNIEALATIETDGIHNFQIGEKQIATGRKYSTTEPGWTWDVGLQVGLFHGKVSKGQPSSHGGVEFGDSQDKMLSGPGPGKRMLV